MDTLEKVLALQEKIKSGEVAVADFTKYSGAPKQTFYNLRDDKVTPEKMTLKVANNLAKCYDILFPVPGTSRDYRWGRLFGILDYIRIIDAPARQALDQAPNTWFLRLHKKYMDKYPKEMADLSPIFQEVMNTMDESDMTNEPLSGVYLLGEGKEHYRLSYMYPDIKTTKWTEGWVR